jgi:hypothetical protein
LALGSWHHLALGSWLDQLRDIINISDERGQGTKKQKKNTAKHELLALGSLGLLNFKRIKPKTRN